MMKDEKQKTLKAAISKVKMYDAERKNEALDHGPLMSDYPMLCIDSKEAPFLKGYNVGDKCTIVIETRVASHSSSDSDTHKEDNFRLEVHNIGQIDHTPVDEKEKNY